MNERLVGHEIGAGYITVSARAYSIPEALALESALRQVAPAKAFQPVVTEAATVAQDATPELPPELEAIAYRDADESGPQMMDKAEAVSR